MQRPSRRANRTTSLHFRAYLYPRVGVFNPQRRMIGTDSRNRPPKGSPERVTPGGVPLQLAVRLRPPRRGARPPPPLLPCAAPPATPAAAGPGYRQQNHPIPPQDTAGRAPVG